MFQLKQYHIETTSLIVNHHNQLPASSLNSNLYSTKSKKKKDGSSRAISSSKFRKKDHNTLVSSLEALKSSMKKDDDNSSGSNSNNTSSSGTESSTTVDKKSNKGSGSGESYSSKTKPLSTAAKKSTIASILSSRFPLRLKDKKTTTTTTFKRNPEETAENDSIKKQMTQNDRKPFPEKSNKHNQQQSSSSSKSQHSHHHQQQRDIKKQHEKEREKEKEKEKDKDKEREKENKYHQQQQQQQHVNPTSLYTKPYHVNSFSIPSQVLVYPVTDFMFLPGSLSKFPFSEQEYIAMGSPSYIGFFMTSDLKVEDIPDTQDTQTTTTTTTTPSDSVVEPPPSNNENTTTEISTTMENSTTDVPPPTDTTTATTTSIPKPVKLDPFNITELSQIKDVGIIAQVTTSPNYDMVLAGLAVIKIKGAVPPVTTPIISEDTIIVNGEEVEQPIDSKTTIEQQDMSVDEESTNTSSNVSSQMDQIDEDDQSIGEDQDDQLPQQQQRQSLSSIINSTISQPLKPGLFYVDIEPLKLKSIENRGLEARAIYFQLIKKVKLILTLYPESQYAMKLQGLKEQSTVMRDRPEDYAKYVYLVANGLCTPSDFQKLIETNDIVEKLNLILSLVVKKIQAIEFHTLLERQYEEKSMKQHKRFYMMEQMKIIRKELGIDQDEKEALKTKFNQRWAQLNITDEQTKQVFKEEMERLAALDPSSSEYNVTRNYIEWITTLPWNTYTNDNFDNKLIKESLDKDHYGLDDIKEMIQSFIAVGKLRGSVGGKIILLVGPPGTGKTSIGKSIANALNRQFYRFSVGGISDVAEIKGHRRTFIGSMPGKIIQALKMVKSSNPVILIDEIDKISKGHHSDPYAALLEVLDPQQNKTFLDHYLDIPYDLSKVLFICTANLTDTIPHPLLDRMDVMRLNGYIQSEQIEIAERYLVPSIRNETGLNNDQIEISNPSLKHLCEYWCRESGVRNLKKTIEKIFRKTAFKIATKEIEKISITPDNLEEYAGLPKYRSNRYYNTPQVGVTLGLGWTENGGIPLYVESVVDRYQPTPRIKATGSLGEVMKESIDIAYTYAKKFLFTIEPDNLFFDKNAIHIHAPEGSTPKDGPSAGITVLTSLLSLALGKPIKPNLAMTGEVTLTGKVIAVGGVTEKMIAAKREGVKQVIIPSDNKKELEEIPDFVKEGIEIFLVDYYKDVYEISFTDQHTQTPVNVSMRKKKDYENQNTNNDDNNNDDDKDKESISQSV
eukprot:gene6790-8425_t